ncbi:hypothetical protein BJ165DRAFT_1501938 [Panaeolus papilionaceus]|nr:hypothetical protein BJ165DRAFT_1501938 [Panaeolus papilionaceus]
MEDHRLNSLEVTGDISIEPVTRIPSDAVVYVIMGPTGAGKSTFIEVLAGGSQKLAISSNQLAGFTQRVNAYKLCNVVWGRPPSPIYLVDTPGFSDDKISEIEVTEMLRDWLGENCSTLDFKMLFLTPITAIRLPGSRRRTIKMLKEWLGKERFSVTITTTMWDTLPSQRTRSRAEKTFEQLSAKVFNDFYGEKTNLKRFTGTRTSALQVMDFGRPWSHKPFGTSSHTPNAHLYHDLHERIEGALQKKVMIEADLAHSDTQANNNLRDILEQDRKENNKTLAKFIFQLAKFGQPPHEFREGMQALRRTIVDSIVPAHHKMHDIFQQWAEDPRICSELVADPKLAETILSMLTKELEPISCEHQAVDHGPSKKLDSTETFRQLRKSFEIRRPNWLKRKD